MSAREIIEVPIVGEPVVLRREATMRDIEAAIVCCPPNHVVVVESIKDEAPNAIIGFIMRDRMEHYRASLQRACNEVGVDVHVRVYRSLLDELNAMKGGSVSLLFN